MELTKQVTSREISEKMCKLGFRQESFFWWIDNTDRFRTSEDTWTIRDNHVGWKNYVSAYSCSELGEMLPRYIHIGKYMHGLKIIRSSVWRFYYGTPEDNGSDCVYLTAGNDDTEADARAKMLIYLTENGLIQITK